MAIKSNAYNFSNDLQRIGSSLANAMIGNAQDDAAIARAGYYNAQTAGQEEENAFLKGRNDAVATAANPTGILAQSILNSMGMGFDANNNLTKLLPPGSPAMSVPALPNQTTMSNEDILAQSGALARAFFADGKYNPNQFVQGLGGLGQSRDEGLARSMIFDPATTEEALRRAAIILNQDQFVKLDTNTADNIAAGERNAADNVAAGERNAADNIAAGERNAADNIAAGERNTADNIAAGERNAADNIAAGERNTADNIAAGERNAADNIAAGERNAADNIAAGERNTADNVAAGERNAADNIAAGERNTADNIAAGERNAADNIAAGERNAADNIAAGERNDADNRAAAAKPGSDTRKRPSVKETNQNWTAITDAVDDYDDIPTVVQGKLRSRLLAQVDAGMKANPSASYDAIYAQAVVEVLSAGVIDIDPPGGFNAFGFPAYFYTKLRQQLFPAGAAPPTEFALPTREDPNRKVGRREFVEMTARELGYSSKQVTQIADQILTQ